MTQGLKQSWIDAIARCCPVGDGGDGNELSTLPEAISLLHSIVVSQMNSRVKPTGLIILCDVKNKLSGVYGAARFLRPQKGAASENIIRPEGSPDAQTPGDKAPLSIAQRAKKAGISDRVGGRADSDDKKPLYSLNSSKISTSLAIALPNTRSNLEKTGREQVS